MMKIYPPKQALATLIAAVATFLVQPHVALSEPNGLPDPTSDPNGQFVFVPQVIPPQAHAVEIGPHPTARHVESLKEKVTEETIRTAARPRVVLALGGGGMRGAAHVGVLKVLKQAGVPIDGIAGTSMGAVVGGLYCAGVPIDSIEERFSGGSLMHAFMNVPLKFRFVVAPIMSSPRLIGFHPYDGLYFGYKFKHYLEKAVPKDKSTIESLNIPFAAVAIDVCDGHVYSIRKGDLALAMRASSAVPALRKPIFIDGKLFVDGGVLANVPVQNARQLGGDIVIAVQIDERFEKKPPKAFRKMGSITKRVMSLQLVALDSFHQLNADVVIHPNVTGIDLLSTKKSDAKRAIAAGEEAARALLPSIDAKLRQSGLAGIQQPEMH